MRNLISMTAIALALSVPAYAADASYKAETTVKKDDDGDYKATTTEKSTDADGTNSKRTTSVEVDADKDGNYDRTVKTKTVNDPEGLMNKTTVETKKTEELNDGKLEVSTKKKVNGDTVVDTKEVR